MSWHLHLCPYLSECFAVAIHFSITPAVSNTSRILLRSTRSLLFIGRHRDPGLLSEQGTSGGAQDPSAAVRSTHSRRSRAPGDGTPPGATTATVTGRGRGERGKGRSPLPSSRAHASLNESRPRRWFNTRLAQAVVYRARCWWTRGKNVIILLQWWQPFGRLQCKEEGGQFALSTKGKEWLRAASAVPPIKAVGQGMRDYTWVRTGG